MDLSNIDLLSLQTKYMQSDLTTQALCAALTPQFQQLPEGVKACLIYSRINELDSAVLDELAWQMHVDWYDANATVDIKRSLVKNALKVHKYRGTPYAVEQVVKDYFGDGYVEEWYQYTDGVPYHFRVVTSNPSVTGELATLFASAVDKVKRKSTIMDTVIVDMSAQLSAYYACALQVGDFYTIEQVV